MPAAAASTTTTTTAATDRTYLRVEREHSQVEVRQRSVLSLHCELYSSEGPHTDDLFQCPELAGEGAHVRHPHGPLVAVVPRGRNEVSPVY